MKSVLLALTIVTPCLAGETLNWTKTDGTTVKGELIEGNNKSITILVPMTIPMADLDESSRKQAEDIAMVAAIVKQVEGRLSILRDLHHKFAFLYSEHGRQFTPDRTEVRKKLLARIERQIQNNGSTVDACFIQLAAATKAFGKKNYRRVGNSLANIVSILLGSNEHPDQR